MSTGLQLLRITDVRRSGRRGRDNSNGPEPHRGDKAFVELDRHGREVLRETHSELIADACNLAAAMTQAGWGGRRLLVCLPNGIDFVRTLAACLEAGVVAIPVGQLRTATQAQRLLHIVRDADACAMLVEGVAPSFLASAGLQIVSVAKLRTGEVGRITPSAQASSGIAFVQYTSGSTADPKGAEISVEALIANLDAMARAVGLNEDDSGLSWLPMFHDFGLVGSVFLPLRFGYEQAFLDPLSFLQRPVRWLEAMHERRATLSGGPNFAYRAVVERVSPEQVAMLDLKSWRVASNGAEPVSAEVLDRFCRLLAPAGFRPEAAMPCYGLAEATLFVTGGSGTGYRARSVTGADGCSERRLVSSGPIRAEIPVRITPRPGAAVEAGLNEADGSAVAVGEIEVGGPALFSGYLGRPEATSAQAGQRWLSTGDLGFIEDGELYVLGRISDTIIVRGRNIHPSDIEQAVAAVVAAARPNAVVAFDGTDATGASEQSIVVLVEGGRGSVGRTELAGYEADARRAVADLLQVSLARVLLLRPRSLPRTSSGKPRRSASRALFQSGAVDDLLCAVED